MSEQESWGERIASIRELFTENRDKIFGAAPPTVDPDRYIEAMMQAIGRQKDLATCTKSSLVLCLTESATLGLVIGGELGYGYAVPRSRSVQQNGNWTKILEAQFQAGYKGKRKLCYDSPLVAGCTAQTIYDNDAYEIDLGTVPRVIHKLDLKKARGNPIGFYGIVQTAAGFPLVCPMSMAEMEEHRRKYCPGSDKPTSAWQTAYNRMAEKTALTGAMRHAPMQTELAQEVIGRGEAEFPNVVLPESFESGTEASANEMDAALSALEGEYGGPSPDEAPELFE